ncbi:MAG: DUF3365 domain-containing protein [Nitrospirae bacterium]|nr:DUF3365 domain-containing protein [Nitrospirota bacterium]
MKGLNLSEKIWAKNYLIIFLVLWAVLVSVSAIWNIYRNRDETVERALIEARTIFQHNLAYRRWNTQHGGVYVKVDEESRPNPYLVVPDRDIITKDGGILTLVNPFRMTKQAYELLLKQTPLAPINRVVSQTPLNPDNEPNEWERKALMAFKEKGIVEVSELTKIKGDLYMRLIKPYVVEEGCLKCHGIQGYKVGDIRGGMSISVPMQPYYEAAILTQKIIVLTHFFLWLLGTLTIILFSRGLRKYQNAKKRLEEQLFQSQKMESLGHFACGIAHDFNNVLSAINGFAFLLYRALKIKDEGLAEYVKHIDISAKLGKNLTANLLAFGRKQIVKPKAIKLSVIINNLSEILKTLVSEDIELKLLLSDEDFYIFADQHQIEQVIINLCTNAKSAMPAGGELTIQTNLKVFDKEYQGRFSTIPPGYYMSLSIGDTGTGIDSKYMEHIFEPFFTTKEPGRGTGLGLAIVYTIVSQYNGFIDIISESNKGTTFSLYFPTYREHITEATLEDLQDIPEVTGRGETILIAEDEEKTRRFLGIFLQQRGYNTILAEDGEDAVKKYIDKKELITMVILDVVLPKKNGKEVYNIIKAYNPEIHALFISGYTDDILTAKGIFDEGLNFLPKPLDAQTFLTKVQSILYKS